MSLSGGLCTVIGAQTSTVLGKPPAALGFCRSDLVKPVRCSESEDARDIVPEQPEPVLFEAPHPVKFYGRNRVVASFEVDLQFGLGAGGADHCTEVMARQDDGIGRGKTNGRIGRPGA